MNELRRKVLALLGSDIGREVLADVVIDVVARSLGRLGGRPRNGSPAPSQGEAETDTERPEMSNNDVSKPVSEPAGNPHVEGGGGVSGSSLTLIPDPTPVSKSPEDREFDEWWARYPKKVGKADAQRAWKKRKPPIDRCIATLEWQVVSKPWREGFVPNPATWINGGRWEDQPPAPKPGPLRPYHAPIPEPTYNRPAPWPAKEGK